ncbi:RusA family crossover junction endodeoxyribonuclease [Kribbella sp. VKM Ac-2568]|uniref:RusA family crossover junction endodeoxyribonuclease n=1 Tax=Kribbella sp. VKM Ac-2568 TaxID=2512219 RepID=UPI00104EA303|nr:RusA family crossover junction endodeoxyribonuclease [Kribbella sp. VKM Ac-2568]TCM36010.1 endodeoxyribonuclease RusA [Kribbella sp. VKM Ac-2568]
MVDPIDIQLIALGDQAAPDARLAVIWASYQAETGIRLSDPPSQPDKENVASWLIEREIHGDLTLAMRVRRLVHTISPRADEKVNSLAQLSCLGCVSAPPFGDRISFAIRVRPFTMQTNPGIGGRLKAAITNDLTKRRLINSNWSGAVCITIVMLLAKDDSDKDVDNSVKGVLDALQGVVYTNDSQIQHLSSHKLRHQGSDRYYRVDARQVHPHTADIIDQRSLAR